MNVHVNHCHYYIVNLIVTLLLCSCFARTVILAITLLCFKLSVGDFNSNKGCCFWLYSEKSVWCKAEECLVLKEKELFERFIDRDEMMNGDS